MIYKKYSLVLIIAIDFYFGDVFGNIILIGQEGVMDIINSKNEGDYVNEAKMITMPGCFKISTVLQCGSTTIDFVNKKKIFAEIFLNYNDRVDENSKINKMIKITFGEKYITLSPKETYKNYSYDENGINLLQQSIRMLNNKVLFNVIKIYESNHSNNRTLAHSTVYDNTIKVQLYMIEKHPLWKYVKEEIVNINISTRNNITITDFINNSTTYKKNVALTLEEARRIMDDRTFKYAFLLLVYIYMTLKIDREAVIDWELFKKVFKQLSTAQIYPKESYDICYDLRLDFLTLHEDIISGQYEKTIKGFMMKYSKLFLTSREISDLARTHKLPQNVLNKVFQEFPKPHEKDVISYNFETIPNQLDDIKKKLEIIFRLITTEYKNFFDLTSFRIENNQLTLRP
ncbi:uncharacterized protein LOC126908695 [Daktulosphaira vitifoliae]|uniref:uncharacterized protein LOC126908695 n=1 Tax=Daktulosphaira vitifoliae TaxID=58002 RepID=UPI0021AA4122|nr:uncharacterized protein LOC126908695 [Daktulosphaira vitifoliae]